VKTPPSPAGRDGAELPPSQNTTPETVAASEAKTATPPAAPVDKITLPPPLRLDDQVQEEVRQMLLQEGVPDPPPENRANPSKEPRLRLGW
jgi:hypothetical protein